MGNQDDLCDFASETVDTLSEIFYAILIHRGVDLVADEEREHVIGEDRSSTISASTCSNGRSSNSRRTLHPAWIG
jgi:hypothetical protein